jgi:hypothetical protein
MKRFGLFFIIGSISTTLFAMAASKLSHYIIVRWKNDGVSDFLEIGLLLESASKMLTYFGSLMLPSSTTSLAVAILVAVINFSLWGAIFGVVGYCLTSRSRPTR